jgi:ABC-type antimicrobial peptide transport system permease subunit
VRAGVLDREGMFNLHFVLAFAVAIPVLLVTSGVGLAERRRETGVLKALGWHTDEILVRGVAESLVLAASGAAIAVILAFVWLKALNGVGIAGVFLAGADGAPGFVVPFRLAPEPALVAAALSFVVTATGTLLSTWRAAVAAPMEAMR